ncbi:hypothetical protein HDU78_004324 [Chytriomyces hyalinus]|nr:hypothetical protein HDU78_004324 [Chytriomyces hyalinus]
MSSRARRKIHLDSPTHLSLGSNADVQNYSYSSKEEPQQQGHAVSPIHFTPAPTSGLKLIREAMPSVFLSLGGLMLAGTLLDALQKWDVFIKVPQLFILVPTLLGLKGNLEMNLASRLGTASSQGHLDKPVSRWKLVFGNVALLQVQAACVSGIASTWSLLVASIVNGQYMHARETALICASGILTASLASMFLGSVMCGTVIVCRILQVDPDNIAAPVAASLGDLITLLMLAAIATMLNTVLDTPVAVLLIVFVLSLLPLWVILVLRNEFVKHVLMTGWTPLFTAMLISSVAGLVLGKFIDSFVGLAVLVPVMNGICGNIACIFASRISTELHQWPLGFIPNKQKLSSMTWGMLVSLFFINVPAQTLFLFLVSLLGLGDAVVTFWFVVLYLLASACLVIGLLKLTSILTVMLWRRGLDPDNYVFSLITAVGDVVGTMLIVQAFRILDAFK